MKCILYIENLGPEEGLLSLSVKLRRGTFVTPALIKSVGEMCYTYSKHMAETTQYIQRMRKLHSDF